MAGAHVDAVVLSGGRIEPDRLRWIDPTVARKAQLPLLGTPMIEWAVRALRECPAVARIVVVGDASLDTAALRRLGASVAPEAGSIGDNLRVGLAALPEAERVLVISGDLPVLTRAALEDFLTNAPDADVVYAYVAREDILRLFPARGWVYAETPEGAFTGSSVGLIRPRPVLARSHEVAVLLAARRRRPWKLARMLGTSFVLRYLLCRLTVADVERRVSSLLHLDGRGYRSRFPEIAMDVDKTADIDVAEELLSLPALDA